MNKSSNKMSSYKKNYRNKGTSLALQKQELALLRREEQRENIPQVQSNLALKHSFQYRCVSVAQDLNITWRNLLDSIVVAYSTTVAASLVEALRIRRIRLWQPATASQTTMSTVQLTWGQIGGTGNARNNTVTSTSISTRPGYIDSVPPPNEEPAFWHNETDGSQTAFSISCFTECIIQLDLELVMAPRTQVGAQNSIASGIAGQFYFRGLDAQPVASSLFSVLGVGLLGQI